MSYYKLKNASIRKNGDVYVTVADSSIRPLKYFTGRYGYFDGAFKEEALLRLFKNMLEGDIQCLPSANFRPIEDKMKDISRKYVRYTSAEEDHKLGVDRMNVLNTRIASYAYNYVKSGAWDDESYIKREVEALDAESEKCYREKRENYKKNRQIIIRAATVSKLSSNICVLLSENGCLYLADRERYKRGILDDSDSSAICLSEDPEHSEDLWKRFVR